MEQKQLEDFIRAHYPLIGVLIGVSIVIFSSGMYHNWDSDLEFQAANNTLTTGLPMLPAGIINQPPLGFYMNVPFFALFGLSYNNGVVLQSIFGLGCVVLVYVLGTLLYDRLSGLVAAVLFGVVPWQVYMSRIFLIDIKCLFFSMLFLIIAILAVKRNSKRLLLVSGVVFAVALLTKLFAVFLLVPLLIFIYLNKKQYSFRVSLRNLLIFSAPIIITQAVWYGGFSFQNFHHVYFSTDFEEHITGSFSPTFLSTFLVSMAGCFLLTTAIFSLLLTVGFRKQFSVVRRMDAVCVGTVAFVLGLDLVLALGFNLLVPYVSPFKYAYSALPFFCLLAGSLATKARLLAGSSGSLNQKLKVMLILIGVVLLFACLVESLLFISSHQKEVIIQSDSFGHQFPLYGFSPAIDGFQTLDYLGIALIGITLLFPYLLHVLKRPSTGRVSPTANS